MSEKSAPSSSKDNATPQHIPNSGAVGGGFEGEFASESGDIKSILNSSSGVAPPDPKTVLQMQSVFGNKATLQLLRKNNSETTIQPKKKANALPFSGLRMVQRESETTLSESSTAHKLKPPPFTSDFQSNQSISSNGLVVQRKEWITKDGIYAWDEIIDGVQWYAEGPQKVWFEITNTTEETGYEALAGKLNAKSWTEWNSESPPTNVPTEDNTSSPPIGGNTELQDKPETPEPAPVVDPTNDPTTDPTTDPTNEPTTDLTNDPTTDLTNDPTTDPTNDPTTDPTNDPTTDPTNDPTTDPTTDPTDDPLVGGTTTTDDFTEDETDDETDDDVTEEEANEVLQETGIDPDHADPTRWEKFKSGAKVVGEKALEGGKFVGGHALGAAKNIGIGALNATVGLGLKSAVDFWKGVLEVDKEKQQTLYGDHWKAWSFLENTVNLTQAIADITSSIGFLSLIAGAVTAIVFPAAAPFFVLMSTIAGTFATIAHIITGVGRIILSIKLGTRLSELEDDPVKHALVKGTMIRQILGAVANTVGAVVGGIGGAFDFGGSGFTGQGATEVAFGSAKEGTKGLTVGDSIGTGVLNQLKGGTSGDTSNAITEESTKHMVDRKADTGLIQRDGDGDAVSDLDAKIQEIQELKTNLRAGLPDIEESLSKDDETKTMRQQQLDGINQSLPQLAELDKANTDAKEQAETAENASDELDNQIKDVEPSEEKKKGILGSIKRGVKKALKKFLKAFAEAKRRVMGIIADIKAKLVNFMMKLLGVDKPAKEIEGVMEEKQEQLPSAMAKQDENKQLTTSVKDEVKQGITDLDKAEEKAQEQKQQLIDGSSE